MPLKELSKEEQSQLFIQGRGPKTKAVQLTRKDLGSYIFIISNLIIVESLLSVKHLLKYPYKFYAIVTKKANGGIWEEVNNYSGEKILYYMICYRSDGRNIATEILQQLG